MAEVHCEACIDLRENVPELVVNGFTDEMCASLKNDTGLKASVGHNDCTDLNNLNDCLVGNMETEVEDFDVCDWREFMQAYIANDHLTNKAMICAICGIWEHIHSIEQRLGTLESQMQDVLDCLNS